jgi:quinol monooxygenase YgiN
LCGLAAAGYDALANARRKVAAMLVVTGSIAARADTFEALRAASLEHVARSRGEPGCLEHGVAVDANDGLRLVFFERWVDRAALDTHFKLPASRAFAAQASQLAAHRPDLAIYEASEISLR